MLLKSNFEISDVEWASKHDGETVVVMGNGLSLNDVPRELLVKYSTFGTNHIYLMGVQPRYYVCVDTRVLENYGKEIHNVAAGADIAFLSDEILDSPVKSTSVLYELPNVHISNEATVRFPGEYWWTGGTSTYVSLKIAYAMGFKTVLLVGCDRDKGWLHFSDDYPGDVAPMDYRKKQAYHFGIARLVYDDAERHIINLSPPSDLDEFIERGRIEDWAQDDWVLDKNQQWRLLSEVRR